MASTRDLIFDFVLDVRYNLDKEIAAEVKAKPWDATSIMYKALNAKIDALVARIENPEEQFGTPEAYEQPKEASK